MTFWASLKTIYRESWLFLFACPILAMIPVLVELLQHAIEMHIGMYDSIAMAQQAERHPLRMGFGFAKVVALILPIYWVTRFIAFGRDPRAAARLDVTAVRLFAIFAVVQMMMAIIQLFLLPQSGWWLLGSFVGGQLIGGLIAAWGVAAPLGNAAIGPLASAKLMARHLPFTVALFLVAMMPLMVPHYLLGAAAIFGPDWSKWPILIADSLLVGWLSALLVASGYVAAMRAANSQDVTLLPSTR
jgi:hypothetical protein